MKPIVYKVKCPKVMYTWESDYLRYLEKNNLKDTHNLFIIAYVDKFFKGRIVFKTKNGKVKLDTGVKTVLKSEEHARDYLESLYELQDWSLKEWD